MIKVGVIALGLGNPASIVRMLNWLDFNAEILSDRNRLNDYSHLILPGVGHFSVGAKLLTPEWRSSITAQVQSGRPLLGICLGMQLLCISSQEGEGQGLEFFPISFERIPNLRSIRVPHMGWNQVIVSSNSKLLSHGNSYRFYYVHSYFADGNDIHCTGTSDYGVKIGGMIEKGNVFGTQFHPEKSHKFGMELLTNFAKLEL